MLRVADPRSGARLCEAQRFMISMPGHKTLEAFQEPSSSGRESAHFSSEKFEPTHVGCYKPEKVHGPDACAKGKDGFP